MKIYTDLLAPSDIYRAAADAGSDVDVELTSHSSRSRSHAFTVHLIAEPRPGRRRNTNTGRQGAGYDCAATWDEWGNFLATLFQLDPNIVAGPYDGREDFTWQTAGRYFQKSYTPCDQHRWTWNGSPRQAEQTYTCSKDCGALRRHRVKS